MTDFSSMSKRNIVEMFPQLDAKETKDKLVAQAEELEAEDAPDHSEKITIRQVGGPVHGYRDGKDGTIEATQFDNGSIGKGWFDSPSKCKNRSTAPNGTHIWLRAGDR